MAIIHLVLVAFKPDAAPEAIADVRLHPPISTTTSNVSFKANY